MCQSQSPNSSHPTPFPLGIHTFVLYVCVSTVALSDGEEEEEGEKDGGGGREGGGGGKGRRERGGSGGGEQ